MRSTSAQGENIFNYPTQSPSSIAKIPHMKNPIGPKTGKMPGHIGQSLMGLYPSTGPQQKQKHENPIPSHKTPKTKLTMHSDQVGRMHPPASWTHGSRG